MIWPTRRPAWTGAATGIIWAGCNTALVYLLIFFLPYQLAQYYRVPLPGVYSFQNASPALLLAGWAILFQLYYLAYRWCPLRSSRTVVGIIAGFAVAFSLILVFMYPIGANDLYDELFRAHVFATRGASPYAAIPLD